VGGDKHFIHGSAGLLPATFRFEKPRDLGYSFQCSQHVLAFYKATSGEERIAMKILDTDKLTDAKWLNLFDVAYLDAAGRTKAWQVATRQAKPKCVSGRFDPPDAVVIAAFHKDSGRVVLTREYRVPLADVEYGFPAGLVDPGESVETAARRELAEETGLNLTRVLAVSPPVYSSAGMTDESVVMIYVECEGQPCTAGNEGSEQIEVILASPEEVRRFCRTPGLKFDAKAWLVLWHLFGPGLQLSRDVSAA
jgi:ADP-ribose pyrophosphatase